MMLLLNYLWLLQKKIHVCIHRIFTQVNHSQKVFLDTTYTASSRSAVPHLYWKYRFLYCTHTCTFYKAECVNSGHYNQILALNW